MVNIYSKYFSAGSFLLHIILVPILIIIIMLLLKRYLCSHTKEISDEIYALPQLNKENGGQEKVKEYTDKLTKFSKTYNPRIIIFGIFSLLFLIFNFIFITSFCEIYPNSVFKLLINIAISIIIISISLTILKCIKK